MKKSDTYVSERFTLSPDGEISNEQIKRFQPSVLPMDRVQPTETILLMAMKSRAGGIIRGKIYRLEYVHRTGSVVVRDQQGKPVIGLYHMDWFAEMLLVPDDVPPVAPQAD